MTNEQECSQRASASDTNQLINQSINQSVNHILNVAQAADPDSDTSLADAAV